MNRKARLTHFCLGKPVLRSIRTKIVQELWQTGREVEGEDKSFRLRTTVRNQTTCPSIPFVSKKRGTVVGEIVKCDFPSIFGESINIILMWIIKKYSCITFNCYFYINNINKIFKCLDTLRSFTVWNIPKHLSIKRCSGLSKQLGSRVPFKSTDSSLVAWSAWFSLCGCSTKTSPRHGYHTSGLLSLQNCGPSEWLPIILSPWCLEFSMWYSGKATTT